MSINVKDTDKWVSVDVDYSKIAAKLASSKQIELVGDVEGRIEDSSNVETGEVYTGFDGSRDVQIIVTYNPDSIAPAATNDSEGNLITDTYLKRSGGDIFGDVNFKLTKDAETAELTITKEGNITGHSISLDGTLTSVNINNSNNFTSKNANIDNIISNVEINSNEAFSSSIGNTTPFNIVKAKKIELLTTATSSGIVLDATTGVMNIAPSVTNTGSIGTFSNVWSDGYFNNLHATNIVGNFTESISFTNISNNVVSYNGSESIDLSDGIYYAVNAFQLSAQRTFSLINGATGSTTSNLDNGLTIDVTDLDSRKLRNTVNTAETTFNIIGDISANAATATKLQTPRTFEITGVTSVPQSFDGTENVTIPITVLPIDLLSGVLPVEKGGTGVNYIEGVVCGEGNTNLRGCVGGYGYIPKWDDTTFGIEESEIFESTDLNIGIGTSTPLYKLDVNGESRFKGNTYLEGNTDTDIFTYYTDTGQQRYSWRIGYLASENEPSSHLCNAFVVQNNYDNFIYGHNSLAINLITNNIYTFGHVLPNEDNAYTLGNETNKWANILSYKFNGFVLDNASERKAGILSTNVPIIGADLSITDNSIVTVDSKGYLKTVDILSTDLMRLSTEQIVTGIKRFDNNVEFLSDLYVNVTGEDRFVYIRDNALTPAEVWRYGYIAEHDDIEDMFVLQHYNGASDEYENVVQFSSVSYALEHKGSIYPTDNNTYTIGTTDHQYANVYSTDFTGHLDGNADTATKLLNSRNFSISGAVTASAVSFNGTRNVVLTATALDATKLTGLVPKASIPQSALPTLITVANKTARFSLTTSQVKLGDIVKQLDTEQMYYVIDINNLDNENGYEEFTTAAVDWSTIVNKPSTFTPSAHTHTISDIQGLTTGTSILPSTANQNNKVLAVYNNTAQWATLTLTGSVTGTATIASSGTISIKTTTNHTHSYLPLSGGTLTGNVTSRSITPATNNAYVLGSSSLKWSSVYATTFNGNLTGNVTGNVSGSSGSCTGNAATATRLQTARTINGVSFNGTANITVYDSTKLSLSGGTMTGTINSMSIVPKADATYSIGTSANAFTSLYLSNNIEFYTQSGATNGGYIDFHFGGSTADYTSRIIESASGTISVIGNLTATRVYNAVYNDYAECFDNTNLIYNEVLHRIVEIDDNECVRLASKNSYRVIGVVSDNYGHLLGGLEEDIENGAKIPVGLAGTLYVYTLDEIDTKNIGKLVCADNNGYATLADKDCEGTIVGKIIGFNREYHQYKVLLILK